MNDTITPGNSISGMVRGHRVWCPECAAFTALEGRRVALPGLWRAQGDFDPNTIMYDWATIVGELLRGAPDGKPYKIGGMYIEFENAVGVAAPPVFDRDDGISYYNSLSASADRDYLRVPLTAVDFESTSAGNFPGGNKLTFFARTEGVVGVNGKAFSNAAGSRVYGGALVAYPDFGDATQDLVFSRFYWSNTANQIDKAVGSQIGFEWPIILQ